VFNVDTVFAEKPATSFVIEWYVALSDDSGQNLDVNYEISEIGDFNKNCELSYHGPDSAYHKGTNMRSGHFILDTLSNNYDKLISFLYPNNTLGKMLLKVDFTKQVDTVVQTIYYNYRSTGFGGLDGIGTFEMFPSCHIESKKSATEEIAYFYYDMQGKKMKECPLNKTIVMQGKKHDGSIQCISKIFKVSY
jgi:hypothetical protein